MTTDESESHYQKVYFYDDILKNLMFLYEALHLWILIVDSSP